MQYIELDHPDWPVMWNHLALYAINSGDHLCINRGHCWQYLGSTIDHHMFRHACHPSTDQVEYAYVVRAKKVAGWA